MSQNENIEFTCPSCNTGLNVPAQLAGVTGPCPYCQASITAPHPAPSEAQAAYVAQPQQVQPQQAQPQQAQPQQAQAQQAQPEIQPYSPPIAEQAPSPHTIGQAPAGAVHTETPIDSPPHSQPVSPPSQPTPSRAAPAEMSPAQPPAVKKRKIWPTILFPTLFLLLAAAVVYLILDLMGFFNDSEKAPQVRQSDSISKFERDSSSSLLPDSNQPLEPIPLEVETIQPLEHDPQDLNKAGEIETDLPDLTEQNVPPKDDSVKKTTAAIKEAREVLKRFLSAQTYEERKPLITRSTRSEEFLAASSLAKPFPKSSVPTILTARERAVDRSFEVFFSVGFEQPEEDRSRIILIRTVTYSEEEAPKIHTDPFIDLYEGVVRNFYDNKQSGTGTFSSIVEFSAYCFDDIPKAETMATVSFYTNLARTEKAIATAYLSKESSAFKQLSEMAGTQRRIPATVSVAWDKESDPKKPFLEVIRVEAINWSL